jgi:hypothetical protein
MLRLRALALLTLPACVAAPDLVPSGGVDRASATAAGATISVYDAPWGGRPYDLTDYVTPVAVELANNGAAPVRVSYLDLALVDGSGRRFAALNPFSTVQDQGATGAADDPVAAGVLVSGTRWHGGGRMSPPAPHGRAVGAPLGAGRGRIVVGGPRGRVTLGGAFHRFAPYPIYRPWFGDGVDYWGGPFLFPPGYASWVWLWSPAYYPASTPPADVLALGLPEGVLEPGGVVSGYVYFQHATDGAHRFVLTWEIHDAVAGETLGAAPVLLEAAK